MDEVERAEDNLPGCDCSLACHGYHSCLTTTPAANAEKVEACMRKIALLLTSAVLVGSLAGCGKKDENKATIQVGDKKIEVKQDDKKVEVKTDK
jgi:hypothetical protein